MATLQVTVPDDVKARFEAAFADQGIDRVITRLMREALEYESSKATRKSVWDHILQRPNTGIRSRDEIDEQIRAERASWGGR